MTEKDIVKSLKRMHRFEVAAAEIYKRQMELSSCQAIKKEITDAYRNERNHIEDLKRKIIEKGKRHSPFSYLFTIGGFFLGLFSSLSGLKRALRMNISLEQKAVLDYEKTLNTTPFDPETKALIERILMDEEKHIELWKELLRGL